MGCAPTMESLRKSARWGWAWACQWEWEWGRLGPGALLRRTVCLPLKALACRDSFKDHAEVCLNSAAQVDLHRNQGRVINPLPRQLQRLHLLLCHNSHIIRLLDVVSSLSDPQVRDVRPQSHAVFKASCPFIRAGNLQCSMDSIFVHSISSNLSLGFLNHGTHKAVRSLASTRTTTSSRAESSAPSPCPSFLTEPRFEIAILIGIQKIASVSHKHGPCRVVDLLQALHTSWPMKIGHTPQFGTWVGMKSAVWLVASRLSFSFSSLDGGQLSALDLGWRTELYSSIWGSSNYRVRRTSSADTVARGHR